MTIPLTKPLLPRVAVAAFVLHGLSLAFAGPSLPVTKPEVEPIDLLTGPPVDPTSSAGQWFSEIGDRSHEFYDNITGHGGGAQQSSAIRGVPFAIQRSSGNGIIAFSIRAFITNDTLSSSTGWRDGDNAIGETLSTDNFYRGPLNDVVITANFALAQLGQIPSAWVTPYFEPAQPIIIAENEDVRAWYGWNPNAGNSPIGDYFVPAWIVGNIAPGQTRTVDMAFSVNGEILPGTDLWNLLDGFANDPDPISGDVFYSRTDDLKIGAWVSGLNADDGTAYPYSPPRSGNVSVFHAVIPIPEPSTLFFLALPLAGLTLVVGRRLRRAGGS